MKDISKQPIDDGGPVHPTQPLGADGVPTWDMERGMSLRDWFAGQALVQMFMEYNKKEAAKQAYEIADAMLEARNGGDL